MSNLVSIPYNHPFFLALAALTDEDNDEVYLLLMENALSYDACWGFISVLRESRENETSPLEQLKKTNQNKLLSVEVGQKTLCLPDSCPKPPYFAVGKPAKLYQLLTIIAEKREKPSSGNESVGLIYAALFLAKAVGLLTSLGIAGAHPLSELLSRDGLAFFEKELSFVLIDATDSTTKN